MRLLTAALSLFLLLAPQTGRTQDNSVVLELFTSQGCSSCPPADQLLTQLADLPGVIALALHVDYWDYLGWKDSFASPKYTKRQRAYAHAAGSRSVFTPQMVVQGQEHLIGHDEKNILRSIVAHQRLPAPVDLQLTREGDALRIALAPRQPLRGPIDVHVVRFRPSAAHVDIEGGENAGRKLTYSNIVTEWETIARWDGIETIDLLVENYGDGPAAVIVQNGRVGPVLSAAKVR